MDAITIFSDKYWGTALAMEGNRQLASIYPCIAGLPHEQRDRMIAKARLKYAFFDFAEERPLLVADIDGLFGGGGLLITNRRIYQKGHEAIVYPESKDIKLNDDGYLSHAANTYLVAVKGQRDLAMTIDYLKHLLNSQLDTDAKAISILVDPCGGSAFVTQLKTLGMDYNSQLAMRRTGSTQESVVAFIGKTILTTAHVLATPSTILQLSDNSRLKIESDHTYYTHQHAHYSQSHPLTSLISSAVKLWVNSKEGQIQSYGYKLSLTGGIPTETVLHEEKFPDKDDDQRLKAFGEAAERAGIKVEWHL